MYAIGSALDYLRCVADGGTRFFDILSPDVRWTILRKEPSAVT